MTTDEIKFDKVGYPSRVKYLIKRERTKAVDIRQITGYAKSTWYSHLNAEDDSWPGPTELIALSQALNTSIDYLITGRGAEYIGNHEIGRYYETIEALYNSEDKSILLIIGLLSRMNAKMQNVVADMAMMFEERMG